MHLTANKNSLDKVTYPGYFYWQSSTLAFRAEQRAVYICPIGWLKCLYHLFDQVRTSPVDQQVDWSAVGSIKGSLGLH